MPPALFLCRLVGPSRLRQEACFSMWNALDSIRVRPRGRANAAQFRLGTRVFARQRDGVSLAAQEQDFASRR